MQFRPALAALAREQRRQLVPAQAQQPLALVQAQQLLDLEQTRLLKQKIRFEIRVFHTFCQCFFDCVRFAAADDKSAAR